MPGPNRYAPMFKAVQLDDSSTTNAGNVTSWTPNTTSNPPGNRAHALVITCEQNGNNVWGHIGAEKVWNAVWNDYADFQLLNDELIPGKCYFDTYDGAKICSQRCQLSVIGIASDTFAQVVGKRTDQLQVPIAVAGWVLAYVDKEYECGTPLTNDHEGNLTEMTIEEKMKYPERIVATYKRKEQDSEFGSTSKKIKVDGRHWVKIK